MILTLSVFSDLLADRTGRNPLELWRILQQANFDWVPPKNRKNWVLLTKGSIWQMRGAILGMRGGMSLWMINCHNFLILPSSVTIICPHISVPFTAPLPHGYPMPFFKTQKWGMGVSFCYQEGGRVLRGWGSNYIGLFLWVIMTLDEFLVITVGEKVVREFVWGEVE